MLIERSTDYGHTWKVLKYFAKDCAASFPNIPSGQAQGVGDLICDSKYSDIEPSTGGEVVLKVLDPSFEIENPYSPYIQDLVTLTNLRINFTKLHTLGDILPGRRQNDSLDKYYYALYEMVVRGSCFCNGHASECGPAQEVRGDVFSPPGMVHGQCVCQHNTDGPNCERCKDFFQDAPWKPAVGPQDSTCRSCTCNGHSDRCHFDPTVYLASGDLSGGVCEDCRHNTEGQHCDRCRPLFYRNPLKAISDPYACIPCECDPDGTISGGICVSHSDPALGSVAGQCLCKENVEGASCDRCKPHHYGLSAADPVGCQPCDCHPLGSLPFSTCDMDTGQCLCQAYATGPHCKECAVGYWGLGNHLQECSPCDCDIGGAYSNMCSPEDGQCECRPHITGRSCTEPAPGYFFAPLNFYLYEAEEATPLQGLAPLDSASFGQVSGVHIVFQEPIPGNPITWTGRGFARVLPGAGLRFTVNNIPFPMNFAIAVRYEIQFTGQCPCRLGYGGLRCSECEASHYGDRLGRCISCNCNREGTQKSVCDPDTGMCHCREGVSGQQCDRCTRGHSQEFPTCPRCHFCFDQWDHTISSLSKAVQGLIRLIANMEDKRETLPVCETDFKGLGETVSEIERILKHPVFSSGELLKVKDYHDSVRKQIMQLSEQSRTVYEFQDLKEMIVRMSNEAELLFEELQEEIDLHSSALNASIVEENVPPEDIEKVANHVLDIHLPITSPNLTHQLDKIQKLTQLCENYGADENKLNKTADEAQKLLVKAKVTEKAATVLLNLEKMLDTLQQTQITQEQANSTIAQLTTEITKIKKNVLQAENRAKEIKNELDLAKQPSVLEEGLSLLQTKLQRNQDQANSAKVQAEVAQRQIGSVEKEFIELKKQYAILQHKTSATGLTKETLGKVKLLKDAAEKLAGDTEDKIRRIKDLEEKLQDLNLRRLAKADQLKQLEDQVITIKNDIVEQENKYASCYS
ncbi:Laminin subunit beta-4 [Tupaia chinensis]|uniref:Laminin subunit beta-4 n=1 Tax=Tupaia chinensis TaxID=246437 RepID=L8YI80_TUPCH|nr:Laminin subunit beta-4 [Tupaia chinensis]